MRLVELVNISKSFGRRHVLAGIHLPVEDGEFVSIIGYSGSGKSTLLNIAAGLIPPTAGEVRTSGNPKRAIVFQNYSLLPWLSAFENVLLAVESAFPEWKKERRREHAEKYLEMVGLRNALDKKPTQLSGGMRQRVAIARAFAVEPDLLFLDEPFSALDALTRSTLQKELIRIRASAPRPVTTLMITNSVDEAILLSDRLVPMSRGPQARLGSPIQVGATADTRRRVIEFLTGVATPEPAPIAAGVQI